MLNRGGVENTRLEAKAKDTKKNPRPRSRTPFRGQTLSRPRTGTLEAKAKDQGHRRKCSPKKRKKQCQKKTLQAISKKRRSSMKIFRRSPKKKVFKNFFKRSAKLRSTNDSKYSAVLEPKTGQFLRA